MSLCTLSLLPSTVDRMNTPITASSDSSQRMATMMCPPPPTPSLHTSQDNLVELTTRHEHEQQQRSMNLPYFPQLALSSLPLFPFPSSLSMETNLSHDATTPINNIKEPVVIVSPAGRSRRRRIPQLQQRKRSFNESQQQQQELSVAPVQPRSSKHSFNNTTTCQNENVILLARSSFPRAA